MLSKVTLAFCSLFLFTPKAISLGEVFWQSKEQPPVVIELFTSEGCSSCPPADQWLSQWKKSAKLWTDVIPMALHVDYWDDLGWTDPFASPSNSQRQRQYRSSELIKSVYTPGFIVSGQEWRGWFSGKNIPANQQTKSGILSFRTKHSSFTASYKSAKQQESLQLWIAWLAFGIENKVTAGENSSKVLTHDFVVINKKSYLGSNSWKGELPPLSPTAANGLSTKTTKWALAVWVEAIQNPKPLQAVAGWFSPDF